MRYYLTGVCKFKSLDEARAFQTMTPSVIREMGDEWELINLSRCPVQPGQKCFTIKDSDEMWCIERR